VTWLLATLQAEGADRRGDAVTVSTFHAAKGLEWSIVHLAGLEDGLVPIAHARAAAERTEEARLLYVAMTRAEDELRCSWAVQRTFTGRVGERALTPWLAGLAARQRAAGEPPSDRPPDRPPEWRRHLADQRARLAEATMPRDSVLGALHAWRQDQAKAARVEPAALMDDRLLEAIAQARPTTASELAAVPGMGALLAGRIGDSLLAALREPDVA
jgi:DNA helicase-2/ATP-dependent DNA helicase PcrA